MTLVYLVKLTLGDCCWTSLVIQHWFKSKAELLSGNNLRYAHNGPKSHFNIFAISEGMKSPVLGDLMFSVRFAVSVEMTFAFHILTI